MANSNTEHSKELRRKTAAAHRKQQLAEGKIKSINLTLPMDDFLALEDLGKALNLSRPKLIKTLVEFYNEHNQ